MEVQQTPLRTAIMRLMSNMLDNPCEHGLYDTGRFMDCIEQLLCDMMAAPEVSQLSGSEALFGFMGWLTTRNETTVLGPYNVPDVTLITRFMESNRLSDPREGWDMLLTHPSEPGAEPVPETEPENPEDVEFVEETIVTLMDTHGNVIMKGSLEEVLFALSKPEKEKCPA